VVVTLEGTVREDEMHQFVEQSVAAIRDLAQEGKGVRSLADLRHFRTTSPEATDILRQGQEAAMKAGLTRIAELVSSEVAMLQLNRIARASGMDRILRRFNDEAEARRWLLEGGDQADVA
jgi:hypothetical protein